MLRRSPQSALPLLVGFLTLLGPGTAATGVPGPVPGPCVDRPEDRCALWSTEHDDPSIQPPRRSDQFVTGVVAAGDTLVVVMKNVGLDPLDPYGATGGWLVLGQDLGTGELTWRADRRSRTYDAPLDIAASPDGRTVFVTGAAYDAFPVSATDSRIVTVAYDAGTGEELWATEWDGADDERDVAKVVTVSPDGGEVYVGGLTTTAPNDLDYLVLAYDARRGRELWTGTYAGPGGSDVLTDLAVDPSGRQVYATGESGSGVQYDNDYLTVAFTASRGRRGGVAWVARFDGWGAHRSDRASSLGVAPDGTVVVTGDSFAPRADGGDGYDVATVAYDPAGNELWASRYSGPGQGVAYDGGRDLVVAGDVAVVTAQSAGATTEDGLDAVTVGYDLRTGTETWVQREDQPRSSELAMGVAAAPDGAMAYVISSARPVVKYTALDHLQLRAYEVATGAEPWSAQLVSEPGSATEGDVIAVSDSGIVAVAGMVTRSQLPTGPPSQNRYDALVAAYPPTG